MESKPTNSPVLFSFITPAQFAEKHNWPLGGIRHLIFTKPKGFERVIKRVGRKILLDEAAFFDWVKAMNA